jgi:hypothetical protein
VVGAKVGATDSVDAAVGTTPEDEEGDEKGEVSSTSAAGSSLTPISASSPSQSLSDLNEPSRLFPLLPPPPSPTRPLLGADNKVEEASGRAVVADEEDETVEDEEEVAGGDCQSVPSSGKSEVQEKEGWSFGASTSSAGGEGVVAEDGRDAAFLARPITTVPLRPVWW